MQKRTVLSDDKLKKNTDWCIKSMRVKTASQETKIRALSGGNQQKVILGRWLLTDPTVLLLDEPTRGIDVGAKYEIYQLIIDLAEKGKTVIMVSSEMPELLGVLVTEYSLVGRQTCRRSGCCNSYAGTDNDIGCKVCVKFKNRRKTKCRFNT